MTTTIEIGDLLETKLQAFQAHTSQMPIFSLLEKNARQQGKRELFQLVAVNKVSAANQETDLFTGIVEKD